MATIKIENAPAKLSMLDFRSASHKYGGLAKSCRFVVLIKPSGSLLAVGNNVQFSRELTYMCEIAEIPGRSFLNVDLRYYGPNHKLPFQSQYEDLNLTFLCRNDFLERQFFDNWMELINPTTTFDFNYRDDYRAEIDIYQYNDTYVQNYDTVNQISTDPSASPIATYRTTIYNAYPILVNPQPMTWADDQFQRLIISFTYTHWNRKGIDVQSSTAETGYSFELVAGKKNSERY
jgi:hypothetical protein